jgi:hypothetical protein
LGIPSGIQVDAINTARATAVITSGFIIETFDTNNVVSLYIARDFLIANAVIVAIIVEIGVIIMPITMVLLNELANSMLLNMFI